MAGYNRKRDAAPEVLGRLDESIYADDKDKDKALDERLAARGDPFRVPVVSRPEGREGFVKLPRRWAAERSPAWLSRDRRQSEDYERSPESSVAWARIGAVRGMLRRPASDEKRESVQFNYRQSRAA